MDFVGSMYKGPSFLSQGGEFVGLENYYNILRDSTFTSSLKSTFLFVIGTTGVSILLSLSLAIILNEKLFMRGLMRSIIFFPYMTSLVIIALIWSIIYDADLGLLNWVFMKFGFSPKGWISDPDTALLSMIIMSIWWETGYDMVIFLAGLQGIPQEYYDAAKVDGASPFQRFRHVTLPLLAPATFFVVIISFFNSSQAFIQPYVLTQGGPANVTNLAVYNIYNVAFTHLKLGEASAMAFFIFLIILIITATLFKFWRTEVEY
jgi:multiple sugar transport system permease protein